MTSDPWLLMSRAQTNAELVPSLWVEGRIFKEECTAAKNTSISFRPSPHCLRKWGGLGILGFLGSVLVSATNSLCDLLFIALCLSLAICKMVVIVITQISCWMHPSDQSYAMKDLFFLCGKVLATNILHTATTHVCWINFLHRKRRQGLRVQERGTWNCACFTLRIYFCLYKSHISDLYWGRDLSQGWTRWDAFFSISSLFVSAMEH